MELRMDIGLLRSPKAGPHQPPLPARQGGARHPPPFSTPPRGHKTPCGAPFPQKVPHLKNPAPNPPAPPLPPPPHPLAQKCPPPPPRWLPAHPRCSAPD